MKVVIIGGGTAGSEVAWRLRQEDKEIEISLLEKGSYLQYSPCALPYFISNEINKKENLFLFDSTFYQYNKINLISDCRVKKINRKEQEIVFEKNGKKETIDYDYLIITTGSKSKTPAIPGLENTSYFQLKTIDDAEEIKKSIQPEEKAAVIGGGYIGVELVDSLRLYGLKVTLIEIEDFILSIMFDSEIAGKIQSHIQSTGVEIITQAKIEKIDPEKISLENQTVNYDHLFICCGVEPNIHLAEKAGIKCGQGIIIDDLGKTSDKNIYACGDCVQSVNLIDNQKIFSQLATTAVKQAETVAANILGKEEKMPRVLNTSISKFGQMIFGSTGVSQEYCRKNNLKTVTAFYSGKTKPEYYPGGKDIFIKLIAQPNSRLIGCQIAGFEHVAGRINLAALAIKQGLSLEEFISTETGYNPAVSPIFDPLIIAAQICLKKINYHRETT